MGLRCSRMCVVCCVLLCCLQLSSEGSATPKDALAQQDASRGCQMSSSTRSLRVLKPMNASVVGKGSLLIIRDTRSSTTDPCILTISIDGREWVSVPRRRSALQLRLPTLPPGMHLIRVRLEEEQHGNAEQIDADLDAVGEEACVWVKVPSEVMNVSQDSEKYSTSTGQDSGVSVQIAHPPDGSWFSAEPVLCPMFGEGEADKGVWVACSFSVRIIWRSVLHDAGEPAESSCLRIFVDDTLYWPHGLGSAREGGSPADPGRGETGKADRQNTGAYETLAISSLGTSGVLNMPIGVLEEGWHTVKVEVCQDRRLQDDSNVGELAGGQCGHASAKSVSVASVQFEIVAAREAELRRHDLLTWDGVSAALADSRVSVIHPRHTSVLGPENQLRVTYHENGSPVAGGGGGAMCNGSRGVRVLVRAERAALGAGAGALVLRLNGRLLPPRLPHAGSAFDAPATQGDYALPSLWRVSEVDTCIPWSMLPSGTHYLTAALADVTMEQLPGAGLSAGKCKEADRSSWVELPGGEEAIVGFKVDDVRWPAVSESALPFSQRSEASLSGEGISLGALGDAVRESMMRDYDEDVPRNAHNPVHLNQPYTPPSVRVETIHTLEHLLEAYSHFHRRALDAWMRATADGSGEGMGDGRGAGPEQTGQEPALAKVLLYTPPDYGWGNRVLDLASCLLYSLFTDRILLVNWTRPVPLSRLIATPRPRAQGNQRRGGGVGSDSTRGRGRSVLVLDLTAGDKAGEVAQAIAQRTGSLHEPYDLARLMKRLNRRNSTAGSGGGVAGASRESSGEEDAVGVSSAKIEVRCEMSSEALKAHVVSLRYGLRSLPRLMYEDRRLRTSLTMALLPETYVQALSLLLAHFIHPSSDVCDAMASIWEHWGHALEMRKEDGDMGGGSGDSDWCNSRMQGLMPDGEKERQGAQIPEGWYVGMHIRMSGAWDPAGSSPGGLFAMRSAGWMRSLQVLQELVGVPPEEGGRKQVARTGERIEGAGHARQGSARDIVFLATDSPDLRRTVDRGDSRAPAWRMLTSPHRVVHSAGSGACGGDEQCHAEAANVTAAQHLLVLAEWWLLAGARRGWVLTRGSSFGLTAAARGMHHGSVPRHPPGPVYTVHEHKVQRGFDCQTFDLCGLQPPHATR